MAGRQPPSSSVPEMQPGLTWPLVPPDPSADVGTSHKCVTQAGPGGESPRLKVRYRLWALPDPRPHGPQSWCEACRLTPRLADLPRRLSSLQTSICLPSSLTEQQAQWGHSRNCRVAIPLPGFGHQVHICPRGPRQGPGLDSTPRGHEACGVHAEPGMPQDTGAGAAGPVALDVHEVGSLMERAMRLGPGRTRVPLWGPSGDVWWGCGVGSGVPVGSSGDRWLRPGAALPSEARRLELSASAAKKGTRVSAGDHQAPHHEGERSPESSQGAGAAHPPNSKPGKNPVIV